MDFVPLDKHRPVFTSNERGGLWGLVEHLHPIHFGKAIHLYIKDGPAVKGGISILVLVTFNMLKLPGNRAGFDGGPNGREKIKLTSFGAGGMVRTERLTEGIFSIATTSDGSMSNPVELTNSVDHNNLSKYA